MFVTSKSREFKAKPQRVLVSHQAPQRIKIHEIAPHPGIQSSIFSLGKKKKKKMLRQDVPS